MCNVPAYQRGPFPNISELRMISSSQNPMARSTANADPAMNSINLHSLLISKIKKD